MGANIPKQRLKECVVLQRRKQMVELSQSTYETKCHVLQALIGLGPDLEAMDYISSTTFVE